MAQRGKSAESKTTETKKKSGSNTPAKGSASGAKKPATKAELAVQKSIEDLEEERMRRDLVRFGISVALALFAFLLLLAVIGLKGSVLRLLKTGTCGLFGGAFFLLPFALFGIAFVLCFRYRKGVYIRAAALFLLPLLLSAFLHVFSEPMSLAEGESMLSRLWIDGAALRSGGVIPGGFAHYLCIMISRFGTAVLLLILLAVAGVFSFQLPFREHIHRKAEDKQQRIEDAQKLLPPAEPTQPYNVVQDMQILTTPVVPPAQRRAAAAAARRNAVQTVRNPERFDVALGDEEPAETGKNGKTAKAAKADRSVKSGKAEKPAQSVPVPAHTPASVEPDEEDLIFFTGKGKRTSLRYKQSRPEERCFDIPLGESLHPGEESAYTRAVQAAVRQELSPEEREALAEREAARLRAAAARQEAARKRSAQETPATVQPWTDTAQEEPSFEEEPELQPTPEERPAPVVQLTDEDIVSGAEEAEKTRRLSPGEADAEEADVARNVNQALEQPQEDYRAPSETLLNTGDGGTDDHSAESQQIIYLLEDALSSFGVGIKVSDYVRGPSVTRYEMKLPPGTKMSKITSLTEDLALSLGVSSVRVAAVTGKSSTIGIEVPNLKSTSVPLGSILTSETFKRAKSDLAFAVGKDITGEIIVGDIAKMPHLLIAGTTGSGKSVCMNSIIVSMLYHTTPEKCRMIMIDPKVVELSIYNGIPHLLIPVVTDPKKAAGALQWAVTEMERRYNLLAEYNVRDLAGYNRQAARNEEMEKLPQIVIIIDELADLMMVAAKDIENSIVRIAQKARAAGMHLVIATQRPSANVITGLMKSNIPSRIAFAVSSAIDSRIILDTGGAEKLLGKGDMLYNPIGSTSPRRIQGCFVEDDEVEAVVQEVKKTAEADYDDSITRQINQNVSTSNSTSDNDDGQTSLIADGDALLPDAVEVVLDTKQASVSMLQRRLRLGYAHAARIVDEMEEKGIVGPFEGSKPRQLLITREQWDHMVGINPKASPIGSDSDADQPQEDEES